METIVNKPSNEVATVVGYLVYRIFSKRTPAGFIVSEGPTAGYYWCGGFIQSVLFLGSRTGRKWSKNDEKCLDLSFLWCFMHIVL